MLKEEKKKNRKWNKLWCDNVNKMPIFKFNLFEQSIKLKSELNWFKFTFSYHNFKTIMSSRVSFSEDSKTGI